VKSKNLEHNNNNNGSISLDSWPVSSTYIVAFSTEPGTFLFESNVNYHSLDSEAEGVFKVSTDLLRMNKISTDVSCVRDGTLEKFCYCKFLLAQS
jgi:hypothetical protein